jgi:hypothetical protein
MLTFVQFLEELSKEEIALSPSEVLHMRQRFGDGTLQMGHLREDGSMRVPVDCIIEAVRSLDSRKLSEAIVERVSQARRRKLERRVEAFQSERNDERAHGQWSEIEKLVFGVEFRD